MRFVDCVTIRAVAGHGGRGASTFRREKFVPFGGPSGGNGGGGGSVILSADQNVGTLMDLRYRKEVRAASGDHGQSRQMDGKAGEDTVVRVPVGTIVRDAITHEIVADLASAGDTCVIAKGGRGGLGNANFKTATRQAPRYAQPGEPGEERIFVLELKLLADIGIIGVPSVGKSTLISVISNARPKIAAYPFTTLVPNLGIVQHSDFKSIVVADIPGLVEGAHEGRGLGIQFLRHVERCRALVHLIEVTSSLDSEMDDGRDPIGDFESINNELRKFAEPLAERPQIVALSKMDLPYVADREPELRAYFEGLGYLFFPISAATRAGLDDLLNAMIQIVDETPAPDATRFTIPETEPWALEAHSSAADDEEEDDASPDSEDGFGSPDPDDAGDEVEDDPDAR